MAKATCSVPICDNIATILGMCNTHCQRWRRTGDAGADPAPPASLCAIPDCEGPRVGRGWCAKHYQRWKKHGHPLGSEEDRHRGDQTPIFGELWLPVASYDGLFRDTYQVSNMGRVIGRLGLMKRYLDPEGYWNVGLWRKPHMRTASVHRLVLETFGGPAPGDDMQCRHLNGDAADCRFSNLAWGTSSENQQDSLRHGTQHCAAKTTCPAGHPYAGENLYVTRVGGRKCRICMDARTRISNQRTSQRRREARAARASRESNSP